MSRFHGSPYIQGVNVLKKTGANIKHKPSKSVQRLPTLI